MNKFLRFLGYVGVHVLVILEVYLLALFLSSPIMFLVIGILDVIQRIPSILVGKYLIAWLIASTVLWLPMYVYVLTKGNINAVKRPKKPEEK